MGSCNSIDTEDSIVAHQGAIKNVSETEDGIKFILYDKLEIFTYDYNIKYVQGERSTFIFRRDHKNLLINILPPKVVKFNASVAGIINMANEMPTHDIIILQDTIINIKRYEIVFIEGSPGKRVYVREDYFKNIKVGHCYSFECVIDNDDRNYWYRVISAFSIENGNGAFENDAKIVYNRVHNI